ncbi:MAG: carboxypeptidase regulatory-like domain-containing protein [Acidobacteria bacterium]|nr:carboxypeptidase regulatory-like domain-containing protein [Acidobacteriota bacterium]
MGRRQWIPIVVAMAYVLVSVPAAEGQGQGRIIGAVLDDDDDSPIPGALVRAENPGAARAFEATTGEDGRFAVVGLTSGTWTVLASAEGYAPTTSTAPVMQSVGQVVTVRLKRIPSRLERAIGAEALAGRDAAALERDLDAADRAFNEQRWDAALAGYLALLDEIPAFSDLLVRIGNTHRAKGDYEAALAAYERLLAVERNHEGARAEVARTRLAMGDLDAAAELESATGIGASREDLFNLGEVAFASGDLDRAAELYRQSSSVDPRWGKPLLKLGMVSLNRGDIATAKEYFQQVVTRDPDTPEAAQAASTLAALP